MIKYLAICFVVSVGLGAIGSPAFAEKNEDSWAACIWEQAPRSASNWLEMTPIKDARPMDKTNRYELLATRIEGFCRKALTQIGEKGPPAFKAKAIRAALLKSRPPKIGQDVAISDALRCEIFEGELLLEMMMGFGDPKDIQPRAPATRVKCQRVQDDGSLVDA